MQWRDVFGLEIASSGGSGGGGPFVIGRLRVADPVGGARPGGAVVVAVVHLGIAVVAGSVPGCALVISSRDGRAVVTDTQPLRGSGRRSRGAIKVGGIWDVESSGGSVWKLQVIVGRAVIRGCQSRSK